MRITLGRLRAIIRESVAAASDNGASWQVTYTEKDGRTAGKPRVFGGPSAEKMARMYAKSVKNGVASPVTIDAPSVEIDKVRPAGLDDLKAAAKAYRDKHWRPTGEYVDKPGKWQSSGDEPWDAENAAEREAEFFAGARAAGASSDDAMSDLNDMRTASRTRRRA